MFGASSAAFRWLATSLTTLGLVLLSGTMSTADPFGIGGSTGGWRPDNFTHTFCHGPNLDVALFDNVDGRMSNLDVQTSFTDSLVACDSATDVVFLDANLSGTLRGQYVCQQLIGSVCEDSEVTLDPAQLNIGDNDEHDTSKTACHEIGHSVGLTHGGTTDCMRNGEAPSPPSSVNTTYDSHHVAHINAQS